MRHLDYALLLIIAWGLLAAGAVEPWAYRPLALAAAFVGGAALLASRGANKPGWADLMVASSACCHTDERQSRMQEWRASREGRRREAG